MAVLSFSYFGSAKHPLIDIVRQAVEIVKKRAPDLEIDGQVQLETAVVPEVAQEHFPFSKIQGDAKVLIYPDLDSANIAYKLMQRLGGTETIGPTLTGLAKPVRVVGQATDDNEIINSASMAVVEAQLRE